MRKAQDIRKQIAEKTAEVQAIVELAKTEDRELSAEEKTIIDRIQGIDDQPGELSALQRDHERAVKFESRCAEIANGLHSDLGTSELEPVAPSIDNLVVPAKAKAQRQLEAFKGEHAERDAYVSGQVLLAGIYGNESAKEWCDRYGLTASMSSKSGGSGGFLVPDEMQRTLIRLREERGVFERYANSVPMGSDTITAPALLSDVTAYWVGQESEITASDATLGERELVARKLGCLTKVSTELAEDAVVEIGDMITSSMAYAMADKVDEAGFNGDGTSAYGGITGLANALDSSAVQDAVSGNVSAATLDLADFEKTVGLLPEYPGAQPTWFMHKTAYWNSVRRLLNAAGGNTLENLGGGMMQPMLFGYPVQFVQVMSTGTAVSTVVAYFGDLRLGASVGNRRAVNTLVSPHRYMETDQIGIRCTQRIGILVHEIGDTIRTRPVVALKTAAS